MTQDQIVILAILGVAFVLFIWGRWRYDLVAFCALIVAVLVGVVDAKAAFEGFGHPAVITVAAVLIITKALAESGAIDILTRHIPTSRNPTWQLLWLCGAAAILSAFMNNIGALALLMPVAIQMAAKEGQSPATLLMPLSFGSILGGLATQIGTPPNIIIASYRAEALGQPYKMFDFAPVGAVTAVVGVIFVVVIGWRLIPLARRNRRPPEELFDIEDYVAEARIPKESKAIGMSVNEVDQLASEADADIVGLIRKGERITLNRRRKLQAGDILIFEAAPESIASAVKAVGLELVAGGKPVAEDLKSDDVEMIEAVIGPNSMLEGRSAGTFRLRQRYRVSLLAATRRGKSYKGRLKDFEFQAGDVLLLLGDKDRIPTTLSSLGLLPLAARRIELVKGGRAGLAGGLFALAIIATATGQVPATVALGAAVVGMILTRIISLNDAYGSIDWSIVILLGALIPVGGALESTGLTRLFANSIVVWTAGLQPWMILAIVLIVTMTVSDVLNNTATTVIMAPIAVSVATKLGVNADPFLMAVAVGASCAFLTPIGHKNNVLVMGPGGYQFGDYWRMGLPLEVLIVLVSVPMILVAWPL